MQSELTFKSLIHTCRWPIRYAYRHYIRRPDNAMALRYGEEALL